MFDLFQQWQRDLGNLVGVAPKDEETEAGKSPRGLCSAPSVQDEHEERFAPLDYGEIQLDDAGLDPGLKPPEEKAKTSKAAKAALQDALAQRSEGLMHMGIQIMMPHEIDRHAREAAAWLALPPKRRPSSMHQPIGPDRLHIAAAKGDEAEVREIIGGPDGAIRTMTADRYGRTALHFAARCGSLPVVQVLVESWQDFARKQRLVCAATKDDIMSTDIVWADQEEKILSYLLPFRFEVSGAVINTVYSRFKISKKNPGHIFIVYDMLHMEEKLWNDCGLHVSDTINTFDRYRLSYHSITDVHILYKRMLRDKASQPVQEGDIVIPRKNNDGRAGKCRMVVGSEFDEDWQKENRIKISKTATVTLMTDTVKEKGDYNLLTTGEEHDPNDHTVERTRGAAKYHRSSSKHWRGPAIPPMPSIYSNTPLDIAEEDKPRTPRAKKSILFQALSN